ncbi:P2Y purinoceptor 1-like [Chiloscyllium plagiosum]|uniref:P2Y purinoceptor 1-like n=1 Tax=Chiloscyllium plagiosum TaxID=36176 RepID=UPI001CB82AB9|nr:P2Y purinoceptor 1-like [Chiloscyllium plagiosum]
MSEASALFGVLSTSDSRQLNQSAFCEIHKDFQNTFLPVIYVTVFAVGFSANCLVLVSLSLKLRKWTSLDMFLFNLGLADLLYVITLPFLVVYYANGHRWTFGKAFCKMTRLLFHLNLYGSIGFLTCISVQRYLGIVHPMKVLGRWNRRRSLLISLLVWGLVLAQTSADLHFTKTNLNGTKCHDTTVNEELTDYLLYVQVITVTGFSIPLLTIIASYCQIAVVLSRKNDLNNTLKERSRNLAIVVMVVFSICFTPYHVLRYLNLNFRHFQLKGLCARNTNTVYLLYQIARGMASLNSCIDPLVYLVARGDMLTKVKTFKNRLHLPLTSPKSTNCRIPQMILITDEMVIRKETAV